MAFDPRTHAHAGRMQVYIPLKNETCELLESPAAEKSEREADAAAARTAGIITNNLSSFKQTCARLIWLNEGGILDLELVAFYTCAQDELWTWRIYEQDAAVISKDLEQGGVLILFTRAWTYRTCVASKPKQQYNLTHSNIIRGIFLVCFKNINHRDSIFTL